MMDSIVVYRHLDETGQTTEEVLGWPGETSFDFFLLGQADRMLQVGDAELTVRVANGEATYRLALSETDGASSAIPAYLISSRFSEPMHATRPGDG